MYCGVRGDTITSKAANKNYLPIQAVAFFAKY